MKILLASASPRRKELMEKAGFSIEIKPSDTDENIVFDGNVGEYVMKLAEIKSIDASADDIVVSADTVVAIDNKILGKPENRQAAYDMLKTLSGNIHSVYTGVCVKKGKVKEIFFEKTDVEFFDLTDEEIYKYIDTGEPFDKAGGYGVQSKACIFVKRIDGDYYNVVGLPIAKVYRAVSKLVNV
ncbi:MAG TPA: septum formation protein Maf [Clostridiales bacterium]|nr:septum formation protein Maf [Clostridiales bacterium]